MIVFIFQTQSSIAKIESVINHSDIKRIEKCLIDTERIQYQNFRSQSQNGRGRGSTENANVETSENKTSKLYFIEDDGTLNEVMIYY